MLRKQRGLVILVGLVALTGASLTVGHELVGGDSSPADAGGKGVRSTRSGVVVKECNFTYGEDGQGTAKVSLGNVVTKPFIPRAYELAWLSLTVGAGDESVHTEGNANKTGSIFINVSGLPDARHKVALEAGIPNPDGLHPSLTHCTLATGAHNVDAVRGS